jgi:hypothetical protein
MQLPPVCGMDDVSLVVYVCLRRVFGIVHVVVVWLGVLVSPVVS